MEFHEILSEIMEEKGISIPDVARICGLTDSTVRSIIDRKQKKIALNVAFKLSKGLNVSLNRLNGEKENPSEPAATDPEDTEKWLTDLLISKGYLKPGQDLSDEDADFLIHLIELLDAWFSRKSPQ